MRKLLLAAIVATGMLAAFAVSTTALFNDTVTSNSNTFSAGTLLLSVDSNCGLSPDDPARITGGVTCDRGAVITASNVKPGDAASTYQYTIRNHGTLPGNLSVTVTPVFSDAAQCGAGNWAISSNAGPTALAANGGTTNYTLSLQLLSTAASACQGKSVTVGVLFTLAQQ